MIETDRAWAAGFFDGEGWTGSLCDERGRRVLIRVTQKFPGLVHKFHGIMKIGMVRHNHTKSNGDHYTYEAWGFKDVVHVVTVLWPYLGDIKRLQAETALQKYVNHRANSAANGKHFVMPCLT